MSIEFREVLQEEKSAHIYFGGKNVSNAFFRLQYYKSLLFLSSRINLGFWEAVHLPLP